MKNLILLTAFILATLSSCKKDELVLIHKSSGALTVNLIDSKGAPISGASLTISDEGEIIDEKLSDENGYIDFGPVNQGNYSIYGAKVMDGELTYNLTRKVQVVSAETKNVTITPSEYSATLQLKLQEETLDSKNMPLGEDVKIALVKTPDYYSNGDNLSSLAFEKLANNIVKEIKADGQSIEYNFENIPLDDYIVMVYTEANFFSTILEVSTLTKGEVIKYTDIVSALTIRKYSFDQSFIIKKQVRNTTTSLYEYIPYENCQIFIVNDKDYTFSSNPHLIDVKKNSITSSTTDNKGEATFKVPGYRKLYAVYYTPTNVFIKKTSFYNDGSPSRLQIITSK